MQHLKIGILQFNQAWENKSLNYKNIRKLIDTEVEIDLLLLPEMFHTGFSMNIDHAEPMKNSNGINFLKTLSRELNCAIYTSLIIKEKGNIYNRGVFIDPNEKIHVYDKRKTFGLAGEDKTYSSGKGPTIIDYKGWKITLQICYDLRFPELCANRLGKDRQPEFDVILYIANWPEKRIKHWSTLLKARAIENQAYVVACNRVGVDYNDINYVGGSCIINAMGEIISKESNKEEFIVYDIHKSNLNDTRNQLPFLKDR